MSKFIKLGIFIFTLAAVFSFTQDAQAAGCTGTGNCYWVGGTGNTNDTAKWATTSGGATTGGAPSAADNCIFDSASNATAYTATVNAALTCLDVTIANPASGAVTIAGSSTWAISGSFTISSDIVISYSGTATFNATSTGHTITSNGESFGFAILFAGTGGGLVNGRHVCEYCWNNAYSRSARF